MKAGVGLDIVMLHSKLVAVSKEIDYLARIPNKATKVFVVFEKETSQRKCLQDMTTGNQDYS